MPWKPRSTSALFPLFCVLSLILFSVIPAVAQSASVSGRVLDPSSAMVRGAEITLTDVAKGTAQHTRTNDLGFYTLPFVQPGIYTFTVEAAGFKRLERTQITIETAQALALDVRLQIGETSQSVTVDGSGSHINTIDASVSTVIGHQFVENIPLNGRSFQSLMTMIPGVSVVPSYSGAGSSGEITVNGQRTEANYFTVDGVSVNTGAYTTGLGLGSGAGYSGSTPGETALGTTQSLVSIDALQEFRALTSTYSAEYGRTPGGQFTFTTRSGTNEWHGSAFDYFRNDALDANNYFNKRTTPITPRQAERQNDFGGTLGGPIRIPGLYNGKDRSFFFFSYEGLRLHVPTAALQSEVPSLDLRASAPAVIQPFLNAFPLPNGPDRGDGLALFTSGFSSPSNIDTTSIRIDHHFGDKFLVFGRFSDVPSSSQTRNGTGISSLSVSTTQHVDVKTATLGITNTFAQNLTSDLRFNYTWNSAQAQDAMDSFGGATPLSQDALNAIPGYTQGKWMKFMLEFGDGFNPALQLMPNANTQHQINVTESMNAALGRHNLKWGIDYRRLLNIGFIPNFWEQGVYQSENQVLTNTTDVYAYVQPSHMKPLFSNFSAFLQDEWKVSSRLNVSLGLRWELNPAPRDADGNNPYTITSTDLNTLSLAPRGTPLWHTTYDNFAPRFGLAYQLHQQPGHDTVLRVGGGLFYDTGYNPGATMGYQSQGLSTQATFSATSGTGYPLTQTQIDSIPTPNVQPPYYSQIYASDPNLKLPYTWQWNLSLEQAFGKDQTLTLSYVGSAGRRLLKTGLYYPQDNTNIDPGGNGIILTTNDAKANYDALQVRFQRNISHGLQALASYTWAHSMDNLSTNFSSFALLRSDSDFDIRHNFQLGLTYEILGKYQNRFVSAVLKDWATDARITSRSSLPVDVTGDITILPGTGSFRYFQPNRIEDQPLYIYSSSYPGGRIINYAAYGIATDAIGNEIDGNARRNSARGFAAAQDDIAVNRTFPLTEKIKLQFRAEAFNIFNQANMGSIYSALAYGADTFGRAYSTLNTQLGGLSSLYQTGGPRSLQLALKLHF